jgi:predicted TIM-barrel fold metal-dependent hydrolase
MAGCSGAGAEEDARRIDVWRVGMRALAALPNVYVKVSMLEYVHKGWQSDPEAHALVQGLVREVRRQTWAWLGGLGGPPCG